MIMIMMIKHYLPIDSVLDVFTHKLVDVHEVCERV